MKYNRNQFNLLLERMSNRYSYDESIELKNKQLLTEGFGRGFFNILKNISIKTPQIQRLQNLISGANAGISSKNIDELLNARSADGLIGINSIKNDLKKAGVELDSVGVDGLNNYFKVIAGVDDVLKGRGKNSVISIINRLDDTNLTLKQKEKYVAEVFEDNPNLINLGMPDGSKIIKRGNIKEAVSENFVYLSKKNVGDFVNSRVVISNNQKITPKKLIKNNNFNSGDYLVTSKESDAIVLLKSEDATSDIVTKLRGLGYDVTSVDKPNKRIQSISNKGNVAIVTPEKGIRDVRTGKERWIKKLAKYLGIIEGTQVGLAMMECLYRMFFTTYKEYDIDNAKPGGESYKIVDWEFRDCIRTKTVAQMDTNNPDPIPNMVFGWWETLIPLGVIAVPVFNWVVRGAVDFTKLMGDVEKLIASETKQLTESALEKKSIKEIVNYNCEDELKNIVDKVLEPDGEDKIMNDIFTMVTGVGGVDPKTLGESIDTALNEIGGKKEEYDKLVEKMEVTINLRNKGLGEKYKMKNGGALEKSKHFCRRQKLYYIKKKINMVTEQSKLTKKKDWCGVNTAKLDIYSTEGFKEKDDPTSKTFSVDSCTETKKEIGQLIILSNNVDPSEVKGIKGKLNILGKCEDNELENLEIGQNTCYESEIKNEELDEVLDELDIDEVITIKKHEVTNSNKYYGWQYDKDDAEDQPFDCSQLQSVWISKWSKNQEVFAEVLDNTLEKNVDWISSNGIPVFSINEKNIRYFESNYPQFCDSTNRFKVDGVKNTEEECINEFVDYVSGLGCWDTFYGTN
jgi:hypothetical protein